ncbi:hypothetical protein EYF80_044416 [Liparis tanakae]|uniref:Uncharacterized protein n=1 Tax=Liparis tanakae TaxID=230148 RepID=A0A4Z2FWX5_9TELE|nr:hypothetical protein EYF80_044416 [Liparis tanakae]
MDPPPDISPTFKSLPRSSESERFTGATLWCADGCSAVARQDFGRRIYSPRFSQDGVQDDLRGSARRSLRSNIWGYQESRKQLFLQHAGELSGGLAIASERHRTILWQR